MTCIQYNNTYSVSYNCITDILERKYKLTFVSLIDDNSKTNMIHMIAMTVK